MTRRHALLVLLLAAGACADTDPLGPDDTLPRYDLVFSGRDATSRNVLVRASADGSSSAMIGAGIEGIQPVAASDGRSIVYVAPNGSWSSPELRLLQDGASEPVWFGSERGASEREISFSPDGRRVVMMRADDDPLGDIVVAKVSGARLTDLVNLTPNPDPYEHFAPERTPAWSPDGEWIAFATYRSGTPAIWIMRADGSQARQLTASGDHGDFLPSWSPDGREIAFQRTDASGVRVGIVNVATGVVRMLPVAGARAPAWHPVDGVIAVAAVIDHEEDIVVVAADDGRILSRVSRPGQDRDPAWIRR